MGEREGCGLPSDASPESRSSTSSRPDPFTGQSAARYGIPAHSDQPDTALPLIDISNTALQPIETSATRHYRS